ncbi:hypothetical protein K1J57_02045 [Nocardiopsis sp. MT53]|uniref:hypothetical protein n=1 Tax=Nocardiopsis sp. MT53 TaxID=2865672 RepID=UPI001C72C1FE|nr:hypothetical protein [Nocardiopsis sp. MT53]QYX37503.1 hypothetical protein K1J57_02045 [Nocardiopsis sp. MT53]
MSVTGGCASAGPDIRVRRGLRAEPEAQNGQGAAVMGSPHQEQAEARTAPAA